MSAEANRDLIARFYEAFDRCDGEAMATAYTPAARFSDPAFGELRGEEIGSMWKMLTGRASDLSVELRSHDADETTGRANWVATYTFSTGRHVVNDINATFRFENGLIAEHDDEFDFGRWARQALGPMGILVAHLPPLRSQARKKARAQLDEYMAEQPSA
jgi:ketosteroid isomerase-like protein